MPWKTAPREDPWPDQTFPLPASLTVDSVMAPWARGAWGQDGSTVNVLVLSDGATSGQKAESM